MIDLGDFKANAVVRFCWNTNAIAGESITRATNGTLRLYKNLSTTERSSSSGIVDTEDFDSLAGVHACSIDTSDNADAGFYASGNDYFVVLAGATIDGKAINHCLAKFSIENRECRADLTKILNTGLTEGAAGRLAAAFTAFLNVATPLLTVASANQSGDSFAIANNGTHGNAALKTLIDALGAIVDAILADTGTDGVVVAGASKAGYELTSGERDSIAAALLDLADGVEAGETLRQTLRLQRSALVGKSTGFPGGPVQFRDKADAKDRITATVDANGNRTAVTTDAT